MRRQGLSSFTRYAVAALIFIGAFSIFAVPMPLQQIPDKEPGQSDPYKRPEPKGPTTPQVPTLNRWQEGKIFLEQADSLYRINLYEDVKIVKGNVKFRQKGTTMTCDSAYFYVEQDRADCFGNVKMVQGDTLFIYADRLYYNGVQQFAKLNNGPSRRRVILINRKDTLITDSLNYNFNVRLGWYDNGGQLRDPSATLKSVYGQYSPATKNAEFFHRVELINRKDRYKLITDTLYYNTRTGIARIDSWTILEGRNDTIVTTGGTYNTKSGFADLTRRSVIFHRDSNQNVVTLEGDSIVYDRKTEISRAYRFRTPGKISRPVVVTDTANKAILIGEYGYYDNKKREAMATGYPLLMEFSRPDTIFLRADTIRTYIKKSEPVTDSLGNVIKKAEDYYLAKAYNRSRFFRTDIQGVADSITYVGIDSMVYFHRKPVVWSDERQLSGEVVEVHINDSTADWVRLPQNGLMMEHVEEDFYNQLSAKKMFATLENQTLKRLEAEGNVMAIVLPQEEDSTYNKLVHAESSFLDVLFTDEDFDKLKMWPQVNGTVSPIGQVPESDKLLKGAQWLEAIRPIRRWYGNKATWDDQLGEISEELELYFRQGPQSVNSSASPPPETTATKQPSRRKKQNK